MSQTLSYEQLTVETIFIILFCAQMTPLLTRSNFSDSFANSTVPVFRMDPGIHTTSMSMKSDIYL